MIRYVLKRVKHMALICYCKERCASCIYRKRESLGDFGTLTIRNRLTLQHASVFLCLKIHAPGLPWWLSGKESTRQCGKRRFDPDPGRSHTQQRNEAHAPQLLSLFSRTQKLQLLKPMCPGDSALQQEKPKHSS